MNILYEGFPVITTSARKMCEQIVTPPFHFDHLPTQVPKSPHHSKDSESAKILAHFWGVTLPRTCLSQKNPKNWIFLFESVLKLELWNIKSKKKKKLYFGTWHEQMFPSFLWTSNSYFICGQASMLNLEIKIKVSFESQNVKTWILPLHPFF